MTTLFLAVLCHTGSPGGSSHVLSHGRRAEGALWVLNLVTGPQSLSKGPTSQCHCTGGLDVNAGIGGDTNSRSLAPRLPDLLSPM